MNTEYPGPLTSWGVFYTVESPRVTYGFDTGRENMHQAAPVTDRVVKGCDLFPPNSKQFGESCLPMSPGLYGSISVSICPYCLSEETEGESVQITEGRAYQPMNCLACGETWADTYQRDGYLE